MTRTVGLAIVVAALCVFAWVAARNLDGDTPLVAAELAAGEALPTESVVLESDASPATVRLEVPPAEAAASAEDAKVSLEARTGPLDMDVIQLLRRVLPERFASISDEELLNLSNLNLHGAEVTDDDLRHLLSLPNLSKLSLRGTAITDAGLLHLRGLELDSLVLRGTGVTALGFQDLPALGLEALHLCDSGVTGDELYRLPPMPELKVLKLNFLELEDAAIEMLNAYPALRHIELDQSGLTDAGLDRLMELNPQLERIEIRNTKVTEEGARRIAAAYPKVELVRDNPQSFTFNVR